MDVVDALVVTLGLDGSKFKAGSDQARENLKKTREESTRTAKELEAGGAKAAAFFTKIGAAAIGLFAVFTTGRGIEQFSRDITNADASTGRLADRLGVSAKELSAWGVAADQAGGSAADAEQALSALALGAQQFNTTGQSSPLVQLLLGRGISPSGSATEMLIKLSQAMQGLSKADATNRMANAGLSPAMITLIEKGPAALRQILADAQKIALTPQQAENAEKLQSGVARLQDQFTAFGRSILNGVTPALTDLIRRLSSWIDIHGPEIETKITAKIKEFVTWLESIDWDHVETKIESFITTADNAAKSLGGWVTITETLFALWVGAKFIGVLANITRVGSALGLLGGSRTAAAAGASAAGGAGLGALALRMVPGIGAFIAGMWPADTKQNESDEVRRQLAQPNPLGTGNGPVTSDPRNGNVETHSSSDPRGIRNNNPGNLNFAGQEGAARETGPGGRFAVFGTMSEGIAALARQLQIYGSRGIDTVRGIISKYAPGFENDTSGYIGSVVKRLGLSPDQRLDLHDNATLKALIEAITTVEVGKGRLSEAQINAGLARFGGPSANQRWSSNGGMSNDNSVSHETHIGHITVQTQAKDARGIANDLGPALRQGFAAQANTGLA